MAAVFNLEIDDTSPTVAYAPSGDSLDPDPDLLTGWVPYFTGTHFASTLGEQGNGTSQHLTSLDGASLSLTWFGTGIQLYGNATLSSYEILVDGKPDSTFTLSTQNDILASVQGLSQDNHTVSLVARPDENATTSFIAFERAVVTVSTDRLNATTINLPLDDQATSFHGGWSFQSITLQDLEQNFHVSNTSGDQATLQFNGSAVSVNGFRDPESGLYNITLDGRTSQFNGQSSFLEPTLLFFQTGLDPTVVHDLTITNAASHTLAVGSVTAVVVSGGTELKPYHGLPGGTIAALVVASVIGFLLIVALVLILLRRRRRRQWSVTRRRFLNFSCSNESVESSGAKPAAPSDEGHAVGGEKPRASDPPSPVMFSSVFSPQMPSVDHPSAGNHAGRRVSWSLPPVRSPRVPNLQGRRGSRTALLVDPVLAQGSGEPDDSRAYLPPHPGSSSHGHSKPIPLEWRRSNASERRHSRTDSRDRSFEHDLARLQRVKQQFLPSQPDPRPPPPSQSQPSTSRSRAGAQEASGSTPRKPPERDRNALYSFLDFTSSAPSSIKRQASDLVSAYSRRSGRSGRSGPSSSDSNNAVTTASTANAPTKRLRTSPDQISLSIHGPTTAGTVIPPQFQAASPTESLPITVSDIHFRPMDEIQSRRVSSVPSIPSEEPPQQTQQPSAPSQGQGQGQRQPAYSAPLHPSSAASPKAPTPLIVQKILGIGSSSAPASPSPLPWPHSPRSPLTQMPHPRGPRPGSFIPRGPR